MNLHRMLLERAAAGRPITIGLIGAGKFGTMFLAQVRSTPGMHLVAVADLRVDGARRQLARAGWPAGQCAAASIDAALASGGTLVTGDGDAVLSAGGIEVVIEATGDPAAGLRHAMRAIAHGKHVVMVNVEADAVAGPLLGQMARRAGVVYSLAWGDQPALICEHVDWARASGFNVVSAGKGTRYLPRYHQSTPETVWDVLDGYLKIEDRGAINATMFNSFIDGSKSAIEMTAVCNATGLRPQTGGLSFPPATRFEHADICKPKEAGGVLECAGVTEVTSSLYRDGREVPNHLAMGTYVVIEPQSDYARQCIREYNCLPDSTGRYAALYRPTHMIGLELGISVASAVLRNEPTGSPLFFNSDVVATAKRNLRAGEILDGEGGYCVWGRQTPASLSLQQGHLPLGLTHGLRLLNDIAAGECLRWADVEHNPQDFAIRTRREMEQMFRGRMG